MLKSSSAWNVEDDRRMKSWMESFLGWLRYSPLGREERLRA